MLLVDSKEGRVISDSEIKSSMASPLSIFTLDFPASGEHGHAAQTQKAAARTFTAAVETAKKTLAIPMNRLTTSSYRWLKRALNRQARWARTCRSRCFRISRSFSMIISSSSSRRLPILRSDAIREEIVMSTRVYIGGEGNLIKPSPKSSRQIKLMQPSHYGRGACQNQGGGRRRL